MAAAPQGAALSFLQFYRLLIGQKFANPETFLDGVTLVQLRVYYRAQARTKRMWAS